jgi:CelD/BcsL family acetyltransferase involved in cellulose biosynthesis
VNVGVERARDLPESLAEKPGRALGLARLDFSKLLKGQTAFAPCLRGAETSWIVDVSGGYLAYEAAIRERSCVLKDIDRKCRKIKREIRPCRFTAMSPSSTDFQTLIALKRTRLK